MKYIDEYRDKTAVKKLTEQIRKITDKPVSLMEVCGSHTMAIQKFGIPSLLPENITLISGPGCPVCVTGNQYIDSAIAYSDMPDTIITTYGDLIKVPGSETTLDNQKAIGRDIRMVYSVMDALKIATENPNKQIIFLAIGFETTSPATAVALDTAFKNGVNNFFVYSSHKIMPPAMAALIDEDVKIDGYIAPGHVSTITGSDIYNFIPEKFEIGTVVTGFEPVDILQGILMLLQQIEKNEPKVEIQYKRVVKKEGNKKAREFLAQVFELKDDNWRGLGTIKESALKINENFSKFDAEKNFNIKVPKSKENAHCICGEILKGKKNLLVYY
jgi:hydrogenase expression/formation protein HypD